MNNITAYAALLTVLPIALTIIIIGYIDAKRIKNNSDKRLADLIAKDIMKRNTYTSAPSAYQEIPASITPSAYQETPEPSQEPSRTEEKVEARVEYDKNQKRRIIIRKRG